MKKTTKKNKAPNYHATIFGIIIIVMLFLFVNSETAMYNDIVSRRNYAADSVKFGSLDFETIQETCEQCTQDMEELKEMSRLGNLLAELDKTDGGRIGNYFLVYAPRWLSIYLVFFISRDFYRMGRSFFDKRKLKRISKEQQEALDQ